MKVTGILSLSNGTGLQYPFPIVVVNLLKLCDNVIVGVDPNFPLDRAVLESLREVYNPSDLLLVDSPWDLTNRDGGTEIAIKMDELTALASEQGSDWVVVMQADELLHEKDFKRFHSFMDRNLHGPVNGFAMERTYFWKNLKTVREDWKADLVRIFKPATYSFMAEGTDKSGMFSAPIAEGTEMKLPYKIYHYSRVDAPEVISRRVRNLDGLFHPDSALIDVDKLPAYDFVTREFDNFSKAGLPAPVTGKITEFTGTHPAGVDEWYSE